MDSLDRLRLFVRVAELSGFTPAAESLGLPKSSVSVAVRELEERLGVRLLHRTTRRVSLTQEGAAYLERAKALLAEAEDLDSMFQEDDTTVTGRLRVDVPVGMAVNLVIPALPDFLAAHSRLEVELGTTDRRVDVVREGYDCVVRVGPLEESRLIALSLGRMRLINCASPAYLERYGHPESPSDLVGHRLIHYSQGFGGPPDGFEVEENGRTRTHPMAGVLTVNAGMAYVSACVAGLGIIQVPEAGLRRFIEAGALVEILPRHRAAPMAVNLLHPGPRRPPRRTRLFIAWLKGIIGPYLA